MRQAYVELNYKRAQDGVPVTLMAALPSVRTLILGGAPGDLRLPGTPPEAVYALIAFAYDHFSIEPRKDGQALRLNGAALPEQGTELSDGDVLTVDRFNLTLQEGELPTDPPLAATPLRWMMRGRSFNREEEVEYGDESSKAYIEEFELTCRHLLQGERFADVQRLAEAEITRIVRLDESDNLRKYLQYLWWMRVRMAREAGDEAATDIARETLSLFGDFVPVAVTCGVTFLAGGQWDAARDAFDRGLKNANVDMLMSVHDARIGRIFTDAFHPPARQGPMRGTRPLSAWSRDEWNVPTIDVHVANDELLLWRMARYSRVFGPQDEVRFAYRGKHPPLCSDTHVAQRWEIANVDTNVSLRRIIRVPTLSYSDPSLVLEVGAIRNRLDEDDRGWTAGFMDLSQQDDSPPKAPVSLDASVVQGVGRFLRRGEETLRIWCQKRSATSHSVHIAAVRTPQGDDVTFEQDGIAVAIAAPDAEMLSGGRLALLDANAKSFVLHLADGRKVRAKWSGRQSVERAGWRLPVPGRWMLVAAVIVVVLVARLAYVLWV